MSEQADIGQGNLVARKAAAELAAVLPDSRVTPGGPAPADILAVKGIAGPGDVAAGHALGGADGEALRKALDALGREQPLFAICAEQEGGALTPDVLAIVIEAVDPDLVLALDGVAARHVAAALKIDALEFGSVRIVAGRIMCAVDDLEASLTDEARKRRVWTQLRSILKQD